MKQNSPDSASTTELRPPCQNLRSKEMYYHGDEEDAYSSGAYWCVQTQEVFGPDGQPTGRRVCCQGRGCYVG